MLEIFYGFDGINDDFREMIGFRSNELGGHRSLSNINESFTTQRFNGDGKVILDISTSFLGGHLVTGDNVSGVNFVLN